MIKSVLISIYAMAPIVATGEVVPIMKCQDLYEEYVDYIYVK